MAIIKSRRTFPVLGPIPMLDDLENRMRKMFEGNVRAPFDTEFFAQPIGWMPPTDIIESDLELTLTAELPGLERKDIDISVEEGVLTLRGEKFEEKKEEEEKKYHLFERTYGSFQRSFTLPKTVDAAKITAEFEKGVLKVHLPKTAEAKTKGRKIEIAVK